MKIPLKVHFKTVSVAYEKEGRKTKSNAPLVPRCSYQRKTGMDHKHICSVPKESKSCKTAEDIVSILPHFAWGWQGRSIFGFIFLYFPILLNAHMRNSK